MRRNILISFIVVLFTISCVEIALRFTRLSFPEFYRPSPTLGHELVPGASGYWYTENVSFVHINSHGMRDRERSPEKKPGNFRIAVLGDSFTAAFQVEVEATFCSIMEKRLNACPNFSGKEVEVLNFGVSGYGTTSELICLREKVWKFSPDLVLLAIFSGNDITDNSRILRNDDSYPFFSLEGSNLVLQNENIAKRYAESWAKWNQFTQYVLNSSRVIQVVRKGVDESVKLFSVSSKPATEKGLGELVEPGLNPKVYVDPVDSTWQDAWKITEAIILQMQKECSEKGVHFAIVVLSNGIQVLPDPAKREKFKSLLGITDLFYPDNRIEAFCKKHDVPVLALAPIMSQIAHRDGIFFHGFGLNLGKGHWNQAGHKVAGETISEFLCSKMVVR